MIYEIRYSARPLKVYTDFDVYLFLDEINFLFIAMS